jgi:Zn-dependent protease
VNREFRLGTAFGVSIVAAPSLLVLVVLLTWSLWIDLQQFSPDSSSSMVTLGAVVAGLLFFASIVVHELSHSVVAMRRGIAVKRIRLFVFGGVSEIESEAVTARDEFLISGVGPLSSLLLAGLFAGAAWVIPGAWPVAERATAILAVANLMLGLFNLLPGLPLDGGRVLRSALWRFRGDRAAATRIATSTGRLLGLVLVGIGIFVTLRSPAGVLAGLWYLAVGWFLASAASAAQAQENILERISGKDVAAIMRTLEDAVPGEMRVGRLVELYQMGPRLRDQVVEVDGRIRGVVGQGEVEGVPANFLVQSVMTPIGPADVVEATVSLRDLLSRPAGPARRVVVVEDGRVVGIVTGAELATVVG